MDMYPDFNAYRSSSNGPGVEPVETASITWFFSLTAKCTLSVGIGGVFHKEPTKTQHHTNRVSPTKYNQSNRSLPWDDSVADQKTHLGPPRSGFVPRSGHDRWDPIVP